MPSTPKNTPRTQQTGGPAIVDQPGKPAFGAPVAPRRIERRIVTMAEEPSPSRATRNTMEPFPERPKAPPKRRDPGDQEPPGRPGRPGEELREEDGPGYLRLRLGVVDGEARVRGVKFVPGPLDRPRTISAGLSYEARVGGRRVAVGDVPDFSERRSFPDPAGRAGMDRHHVSEVPLDEFTVRIPADEVSEEQLGELSVDLFRWRGRGPGDHLEVTDLAKQPKSGLTQVARLDGVDPADVPAPVRRQLRDARKRHS